MHSHPRPHWLSAQHELLEVVYVSFVAVVLATCYEKVILCSFLHFLTFLSHLYVMRQCETLITSFTSSVELTMVVSLIEASWLTTTILVRFSEQIALTFYFLVFIQIDIEFHSIAVLVALWVTLVIYYPSLLLLLTLLLYIVTWNNEPSQVIVTHPFGLIPNVNWFVASRWCTWAWCWLYFEHEILVDCGHCCKVEYAVWPRSVASQLHYQLWVPASQALSRRVFKGRMILLFV